MMILRYVDSEWFHPYFVWMLLILSRSYIKQSFIDIVALMSMLWHNGVHWFPRGGIYRPGSSSWIAMAGHKHHDEWDPVRHLSIFRADSRFAPSQWETALLCNDVSHCLGAKLESTLILMICEDNLSSGFTKQRVDNDEIYFDGFPSQRGYIYLLLAQQAVEQMIYFRRFETPWRSCDVIVMTMSVGVRAYVSQGINHCVRLGHHGEKQLMIRIWNDIGNYIQIDIESNSICAAEEVALVARFRKGPLSCRLADTVQLVCPVGVVVLNFISELTL